MFFQIQAFPTKKKQKKPKVLKKSQNFKIWLQKSKISNPALNSLPRKNLRANVTS